MKLRNLAIALLLTALTACAQLGLAPAESFADKLAYGYGVHTAVLATATNAVNDRTLTSADGNEVLKLADESRGLLDAAKSLASDGNDQAASSKLVLATAILTQLQTYLRSKNT